LDVFLIIGLRVTDSSITSIRWGMGELVQNFLSKWRYLLYLCQVRPSVKGHALTQLQARCGLCQSLLWLPLRSSPVTALYSLCSFSPPEEIHSSEWFFKINCCSISFPVLQICVIVMRRKMHILLTVILILYTVLLYIIRTRPRQVSVSNDGLPTL